MTNLGAVAAASKLEDFPDLSRKAVRIVVYDGPNKTMTKREKEGTKGYAISFQGIMSNVMSLLPQAECRNKNVTFHPYPRPSWKHGINNCTAPTEATEPSRARVRMEA